MRSYLNLFTKVILLTGFFSASVSYAANDVALVTAVQGTISRTTAGGPSSLEAFVKLKYGDLLRLEKNSSVKLVYFSSGRQETWIGIGTLEITKGESKGNGLADPVVQILPAILVKQIAKTPSLDSQGRAGVMRLRSIPTPSAIAQLDREYALMRKSTTADDLNPEMYLLAGLFELQELDRVEAILG